MNTQPNTSPDAAPRAVIWEDFIAANPDLFPSAPSFRWYVRMHRAALADRGALLYHRNRLMVNPPAFRDAVQAIALDQALRRAGRRLAGQPA